MSLIDSQTVVKDLTIQNNFLNWLTDWLPRHPGEFLTTSSVLLTGIATVYLSFVTLTLAKESGRLAKLTQQQGDSSREQNERSYKLTQHQIDLQFSAEYYEKLVAFTESALTNLKTQATALGIDCAELYEYGPVPIGSREDQGFLGIQLRLHATDNIRLAFVAVGTKIEKESKHLTSLQRLDSSGNTIRLNAQLLVSTQEKFHSTYSDLVRETNSLIELMIAELHPSR